MANQTGTVKAKYETSTEPAVTEPQDVRSREQLNEEIARRAYQLYEQSGRPDGDDLLHWLLAEEEIRDKSPGGKKYRDLSNEQIAAGKK